ncbi:MAG: polyprenyl synthetase family protein, partial [Lentisphaeria bacterium]|nr:polyprenyl synthetase family protein [Lentisphaeria bacterium]
NGRKTGALLTAACGMGVHAAGGTEEQWKAASLFGAVIGHAFQLRDDYLGIFGDFKTFGKPLGSDFQEGKPTLLFLDAMEHLPEAGQKELLALTGLPEYPMETVRKIRALLRDSGAADRLLKEISGYTDQALVCLNALPDNPYRQLLIDLTAYMLDREV